MRDFIPYREPMGRRNRDPSLRRLRRAMDTSASKYFLVVSILTTSFAGGDGTIWKDDAIRPTGGCAGGGGAGRFIYCVIRISQMAVSHLEVD